MQNDLDQLIDGALAQYANPEPLAGLEQRVLGRARASAARRRWWRWAAAIPVAAAILAVWVTQPKPEPIATLTVRWPAPPAPALVLAARPEPKPRRAAHAPKRATFPTIGPLTAEERLWVRLARTSPEQLLYRPPEEIAIKPIEIAPLDLDGRQ